MHLRQSGAANATQVVLQSCSENSEDLEERGTHDGHHLSGKLPPMPRVISKPARSASDNVRVDVEQTSSMSCGRRQRSHDDEVAATGGRLGTSKKETAPYRCQPFCKSHVFGK